MSPEDEFSYFDLPRTTYVAPTNAGTFPLIGAEPRRVGLIIGNSGNKPAFVSTDPNMFSDGSQGLIINNTTLPVYLDQKTWGNLVQVAWFVAGGAAGLGPTLTVIEVLINKWPRGKMNGETTRERPAVPLRPVPIRTLPFPVPEQ